MSQVCQNTLHTQTWTAKNLDPEAVQSVSGGRHRGLGQHDDMDAPWFRTHCGHHCIDIGDVITALEIRPRFRHQKVFDFHARLYGSSRLFDQLFGRTKCALECGRDQYAWAEFYGSIGHRTVDPRSSETSAHRRTFCRATDRRARANHNGRAFGSGTSHGSVDALDQRRILSAHDLRLGQQIFGDDMFHLNQGIGSPEKALERRDVDGRRVQECDVLAHGLGVTVKV